MPASTTVEDSADGCNDLNGEEMLLAALYLTSLRPVASTCRKCHLVPGGDQRFKLVLGDI